MKTSLIVLLVILSAIIFALDARKVWGIKKKPNAIVGATAVVLPTGLNTLAQDLTKLIEKVVTSISVPEFTGEQKVPVLGPIQFTISNLKFNTVKIGKIALTTIPNDQFKIVCSDIEFGITLHWATREKNWPHSTASGDALIRTANAQAIGVIQALPMQNMKPAFKTVQISIDMGSFYIKISGGVVPAILNMLESVFHGVIKSYIQTTIQQQITESINDQLNPIIQNASFLVDLSFANLALDLSMPQNFGIGKDFLYGSFIGEFVPLPSKQHSSSIAPPVPLPSEPVSTQGFQAHVSDYSLNTLGYALITNGYLNKNITPEQVPATSPIQLNTTSLKYMLPDLYSKYPNRGVKVALKPLSDIVFSTSAAKGFSVSYSTGMYFSVIEPSDNSTIPAFILRGDFSALVSSLGIVPVSVAHFNVTGKIEEVNTTLALQESFIGNMTVTNLNNMIRILVKNGIVNYYNKMLKAGIPVALPEESGIVINNPAIVFNNGYTSIMSDVEYQMTRQKAVNNENKQLDKTEQVLQIINKIKAMRVEMDALQQQVELLLL